MKKKVSISAGQIQKMYGDKEALRIAESEQEECNEQKEIICK